jgi:hypothetical protein
MNLDGTVVCLLKAYANIPGIRDGSRVEVPMDVCTESPHAVRMDRNMGENDLMTLFVLLNHIGPDIIKIRKVIRELEDIMIALNQDKTSVETAKDMPVTATHDNITKHIDSILRADQFVVSFDDCFVMFLYRCEITKWRDPICSFEGKDAMLREVMISTNPGSTTHGRVSGSSLKKRLFQPSCQSSMALLGIGTPTIFMMYGLCDRGLKR